MQITDVQLAGGWGDLQTVRKYAENSEENLHRVTMAAWKTLDENDESK